MTIAQKFSLVSSKFEPPSYTLLVKALSPDERRELIDRLAREDEKSQQHFVRRAGTLKGTVNYMAPDFDAPLDDFREYME